MLDRPGLHSTVRASALQNGTKAQAIEAHGPRGRPLEIAALGSAWAHPVAAGQDR